MNNPILYKTSRTLLLMLVFLLPFSLAVDFYGHQVTLATEPLIAILFLTSLPILLKHREKMLQYAQHHLAKILGLMLSWSLIMVLFSSNPLVSFKYMVVSLGHVYVFLVLILYFLDHEGDAFFTLLYKVLGVALLIMLIMTWWQHAQYDFRPDTAQIAGLPFYSDHTLYGMHWSMLMPIFLILFKRQENKFFGYVIRLAALLLPIGVFLSFSRAAWGSTSLLLIGTVLIYHHRQALKWILITTVALTAFIYLSQDQKEQMAPSRNHSATQFIKSVRHLGRDVSLLERVNRYQCAIRMFKERSITGYGPGTFQFAYIPFQQPSEMTRLSTTTTESPNMQGRGGGAHSEYLQALSETGLLGLLWLILLLFSVSSRYVHHLTRDKTDWLLVSSLAAILILLIHGLINNFLHDGRIAMVFYSALAVVIYKSPSHIRFKNNP